MYFHPLSSLFIPFSGIHLASILSSIVVGIMVTCCLLWPLQQRQHPSPQASKRSHSVPFRCLYMLCSPGYCYMLVWRGLCTTKETVGGNFHWLRRYFHINHTYIHSLLFSLTILVAVKPLIDRFWNSSTLWGKNGYCVAEVSMKLIHFSCLSSNMKLMPVDS